MVYYCGVLAIVVVLMQLVIMFVLPDGKETSTATLTKESIALKLTDTPAPTIPPSQTYTRLSPTNSPKPTITRLPPTTFTPKPTYNPIELAEDFIDEHGVHMRLIPSGEFLMGNDNSWWDNEKPEHTVYLDAFYMDIYEVTNVRYAECVSAGVCQKPTRNNQYIISTYYGRAQYANYPVVYVNWAMAISYCEWRGGNLPTEAQWEKAARSADERIHPWGNSIDDNRLNFCDKNCPGEWADNTVDDGWKFTAPVGSYPSGVSPYGIFDMLGNVRNGCRIGTMIILCR